MLVELDADPEVMRYITGGKAPSRAEMEATVHATLGHRWVAFEGDRCVGWFALDPGDGERELGYRLRRDAWGRGFATEARVRSSNSRSAVEYELTRAEWLASRPWSSG